MRRALIQQLTNLANDLGTFARQNPDWPGAREQAAAARDVLDQALGLLYPLN